MPKNSGKYAVDQDKKFVAEDVSTIGHAYKNLCIIFRRFINTFNKDYKVGGQFKLSGQPHTYFLSTSPIYSVCPNPTAPLKDDLDDQTYIYLKKLEQQCRTIIKKMLTLNNQINDFKQQIDQNPTKALQVLFSKYKRYCLSSIYYQQRAMQNALAHNVMQLEQMYTIKSNEVFAISAFIYGVSDLMYKTVIEQQSMQEQIKQKLILINRVLQPLDAWHNLRNQLTIIASRFQKPNKSAYETEKQLFCVQKQLENALSPHKSGTDLLIIYDDLLILDEEIQHQDVTKTKTTITHGLNTTQTEKVVLSHAKMR